MGMSASQMRFCMITGRKSDVEFEGQQINQQRTTLASESSACNEQMLDLTVPTPPTTDDYVTTTYTYSLDGNTNTITGVKANPNGTYTINSSYATSATAAASGMATYTHNAAGQYASQTGTVLSQSNLTDPATASALSTIFGPNYANGNPTYFEYTQNGVTRYVTGADLGNAATGANTGNNITYRYLDEDATQNVNTSTTATKIDWSDTGRMSSFTTSSGANYLLNVATSTDEAAYNDAFNEYQYKKGEYDQKVANINSKVSIIEDQDKKLELKLKNLDTQQEALSTEMDAVKKVIDKNIESGFKTFA